MMMVDIGKKALLLLLIMLISLPLCPTEVPATRRYFLNLSLFHPLSVNQTRLDSVAVDLSLFYSHIGYLKGLGLGMGVGVVEKEMAGIQVSGLVNVIGQEGHGIQMAGIANLNRGRFSGMQWALGFNLTREGFRGSQAAFLFNITRGKVSGAQTAGLLNLAGVESRGMQAAIVNIGNKVRGLQLGILNIAGNLKGVQLGLFNLARNNSGVQVGIFNIAPGLKIGLISWVENTLALNAGIKMINRDVYTIFHMGGIGLGVNSSTDISFGIRHGHHFLLTYFSLEVDLGYQFVDREPIFRSPASDPDLHCLSLRGNIGFRIAKKTSLFLGSGIGYRWESGRPFNSGKIIPLLFIGLEFF